MTLTDGIILGIVQGLAEFLPISSSGHLVLAQALLGVKQPGVQFEVFVHLATMLAVVVYFRKKLLGILKSVFSGESTEGAKYLWYVFIGCVPAGVAGILFKDFFEARFGSPLFTSGMLLVTAAILFTTRFFPRGTAPITARSALFIGLGQACAILPGVSRSGCTIASGLASGVSPVEAAEFSFIMSIPVILGAALLESRQILETPATAWGAHSVAFICSFLFGLLAIHLVLDFVRKARLSLFAYYCVAAGLLGIYLFS